MNKHGFLLIEVVTVIALLSVMVFLISFSFTNFNSLLVRAETEKLYSICGYLQQKAMAEQCAIELTFDCAQRTYGYGLEKYQLPEQVIFGFLSGSKGPPFRSTSLIRQPVTFAKQQIVFYPSGIVQSGTVYLVDQGKNCMYALTCPVGSVSYLRTYKYQNKSWELLA